MIHILFILLFTHLSFGSVDLSYGSRGRSFPMVGVEIFGNLGYNFKIYNKGDWKFGLIRPHINAQTSVVVNNAAAGISFYPISILGFHYSHQYTKSDIDFDFYDCTLIACQGEIKKESFKINAVFAYKKFFLMSHIRFEQMNHSNKIQPIGDFRKVYLGSPGEDKVRESRYVLGHELNKKYSLLYLFEYSKLLISKQKSWAHFLILNHKWKNDNSFKYGLGTLGSTYKGHGLIFVFEWTKDLWKSPKLF